MCIFGGVFSRVYGIFGLFCEIAVGFGIQRGLDQVLEFFDEEEAGEKDDEGHYDSKFVALWVKCGTGQGLKVEWGQPRGLGWLAIETEQFVFSILFESSDSIIFFGKTLIGQ